jgi:nitrogen-specific signal transduction histidine kinase
LDGDADRCTAVAVVDRTTEAIRHAVVVVVVVVAAAAVVVVVDDDGVVVCIDLHRERLFSESVSLFHVRTMTMIVMFGEKSMPMLEVVLVEVAMVVVCVY